MLQALKDIWTRWCHEGLRLPYAHDPTEKAPSITLLFPYITFVMLVGSLIALHFEAKLLTATGMTLLTWVIAVIFYRLRKLDKVKIDINDQSIELDSEDEK